MQKTEIFPLVNEKGEVTGKATRAECHNGSMLLHPVIHIHIFNSNGKLYLQKRSEKKDIFPGLWDSSAGGHIDYGESPEKAAIRETKEELGLSLTCLNFLGTHIIQTKYECEFTYCYFVITDETVTPDRDEVSDGQFLSMEEIKGNLGKGIFTPNFEADYNLFLSGLHPVYRLLGSVKYKV